jgi:hypothetical protein
MYQYRSRKIQLPQPTAAQACPLCPQNVALLATERRTAIATIEVCQILSRMLTKLALIILNANQTSAQTISALTLRGK